MWIGHICGSINEIGALSLSNGMYPLNSGNNDDILSEELR